MFGKLQPERGSQGEEGEDRPGPGLYMGCALSVDRCGDEPDPVPLRGSVRRERVESRGSMRLTKVGLVDVYWSAAVVGNDARGCGEVHV